MANFTRWGPIDEYERLREENDEEFRHQAADEQHRRKEAEWASRQHYAALIRQQYERDCTFFAAHIDSLVDHPRPVPPPQQPRDVEQDRLNRIYWYNLMFR